MKKVSYSPAITAAMTKKRAAIRVPADVLVEQVSASMAIEGRTITARPTLKHTRASAEAVANIAARSFERRESRGGSKE
ncbi:hypothetical protein [Arthrobacter sp. StoSoilB13]|jgi:hypothetical protein|uniref:hypothetical protein n=1 Tax=Arthrobacter sp. StoSoilB13 TaxID=2830993 RepID=UPI001CC64424|nr:hypothetical protein [Arthrobacter sp. StoSoilB13]BCW50093.1 hypothetical protein StoSoilB13_24350 [Arthrobacter sp. StoSoilB13]